MWVDFLICQTWVWLITIACSWVPRSSLNRYDTVLVDVSNVTSICGIPRVCWDICQLETSKSLVICHWAFWRTWISTAGWLSAAVEKTCDFRWIVVLRSISFVKRYQVTICYVKKDNVLSTSPVITPPWSKSTHSHYFVRVHWFVLYSLPVSALTASTTAGIRVEPLTRMTLSISDSPACIWKRLGELEFSYVLQGQWVKPSNFARVKVISMKRSSSSAVMNGSWFELKSHQKGLSSLFSAASFKRWSAIFVRWQVDTIFFLEFNHVVDDFWSKSSPPSLLSLQLPIHQRHHHPIQG